MKIAEIAAEYGPKAGIAKIAYYLTQQFRKAGHEVKAYCMVKFGPSDAQTLGGSWREVITSGVRKVKSWGPDIVHVHSSLPSPAIFFNNSIFNLYDVPVVEINNLSSIKRYLVSKITYQLIFKRAKKVIIPTEFLEGYAPNPLVIHLGVDTDVYKPIGEKKDLGESLLFIGTLESVGKRIDLLIKAFDMLKPKFPDLELYLIGRGSASMKNKLRSMCEYKDSMIFLGAVSEDELVRYLRGCTIFASATQPKYEGTAIPFIEASACGKPVVGFSTAAIPYVVKNGKTGLLARNFEEFVGHLELLLLDKNLRRKMGKEGAEFAKKFCWKNAAEKHLDVFEEVLKSK